jgi:hypothetical protein
MELSQDEITFVKEVGPMLINEIECLKELDTIQYPNNMDPNYWAYKRSFLLNSFTYFAAKMYFLSHTVHDANVKQDFIKYCKKYESIMIF